MSEQPDDSWRDDISMLIDAKIYEFLAGTAQTAQHVNDITDLIVGAQAGVARFMWSANLNRIPAGDVGGQRARGVPRTVPAARGRRAGGPGMSDAATLKAARRLLAASAVAHEIDEISSSATLAGALQAVLIAHQVKHAHADLAEATNAMISGLASAIGWTLSMAPADGWDDGLGLLTRLSRTAALGHAQFAAGQPVTGRGH